MSTTSPADELAHLRRQFVRPNDEMATLRHIRIWASRHASPVVWEFIGGVIGPDRKRLTHSIGKDCHVDYSCFLGSAELLDAYLENAAAAMRALQAFWRSTPVPQDNIKDAEDWTAFLYDAAWPAATDRPGGPIVPPTPTSSLP